MKILIDIAHPAHIHYLRNFANKLEQNGMSTVEVEKELFWDAVTLDLMKKWRAFHYPITLVFCVLALGHIFSIFIYWQWA